MAIKQKQKCGSEMKIISRILQFFKTIKPRYFLSLDSQFYCLAQKDILYRFKVYGEHTFPKFTFDDIKNDKAILYDIHPTDLMKITVENYVASQKKNMLSIVEILRNNKYKLAGINTEEILSGDEICDNIFLIEKIRNIDLYKIAYNTGFNYGRQIAKEINRTTDRFKNNVIALQIIEKEKNDII